MVVAYALASWIAASLVVGTLVAVFFHGAQLGDRRGSARTEHNS